MPYETLVSVFGWMTVLNVAMLIIGTIALIGMRPTIVAIHSRLLNLDEPDLNRVYVTWMSNYKIMVLVFCLTPYVALRLAA